MKLIKSLVYVLSLITAQPSLAQDAFWLEPRRTSNPSYQYHPSPSDWRDVNMYQIFTDRFSDGSSGNNLARSSTSNVPWYNTTNRTDADARNLYQGGDWVGLKSKLDYLKGMGINCIWISGVQRNEQGSDKRYTPYHAYHPSDFYRTEPMFGTFAELKDLIDTAHTKGMYVMLDVVINHMADLNGLGSGKDDQYFDFGGGSLFWWNSNVRHAWPFDGLQYFHNNGRILEWDTYPKYIYGGFVGTDDLKTDDTYVQNALRDAFKNLIDATDCDGFRVDAIKHVDYNWVKSWANDMRVHAATRGKNDFLLFGEYFSYDDQTQANYCKDVGYSFNSTLYFPMQQTLKNVFAYEQGTNQLTSRLNSLSLYGEGSTRLVSFMDNHDVDRIALECGDSWEAKLKPALTFLYTALPVPCLYYGTEHGFNQGNKRNNGLQDGDYQRECMFNYGYQWGNANGDKFASPTSSALYNHIAKLNQFRSAHPSLRRGAFAQRWEEGVKGLYAYSRVLADEESLVVINTEWSSKTCNATVTKPNGTVFKNLFNENETLTVAGGKLAVNIESKGSKIFVAAPATVPAVVTSAGTSTTLTITYQPNDGPLKNGTSPLRIVVGHDGWVGSTDNAMTNNGNGTWSYTYTYPTGTAIVDCYFKDSTAPPLYDNNSTNDWHFDVTQFGLPAVTSVGPSTNYPLAGSLDAGEDLWIDTKSAPLGAGVSGKVVYSSDGGSSWQEMALTANGTTTTENLWHVNLGTFLPGKTIRYAVMIVDSNGNETWDNNAGADYSVTVNLGTTAIVWIGNTNHWPVNGQLDPAEDLWVNIESYPVGAAISGEVVYSFDNGTTWNTIALSPNGSASNNDLWHANLGTFPANATIRYAVKLTDNLNTNYWDNNAGADYITTVNAAPTSITDFGNVIAQGLTPLPNISISTAPGNNNVHSSGIFPDGSYELEESTNLLAWTTRTAFDGSQTSRSWSINNDINAGITKKFYRIKLLNALSSTIGENQPISVSINTNPPGSAAAAGIVYTTNGGLSWLSLPMSKSSSNGTADTWSVALPGYSYGTTVRYAITMTDLAGNTLWDNNSGGDYFINVVDPNQVDLVPPTATHSPSNTTVAATTLAITLSATDAIDPAPQIRYTTNGSVPTLTSTLYSGPFTITDVGTGVDATVRYFAVDAAGNQSEVTSFDVKVNNVFNFGPNKPYSTNPSLGKAVANGAITVDGANNGEWTDDKLVAIDMANDDPRSLGSNWTLHEAAIDVTHVWAAWDDTKLYLAWQFVDTTDIIDPANAGGAGSGKISSNDGILQWIALDTKTGGSSHDMWGKNKGQPLWTGVDKPDVQIYLAGSLWQGFISRAVNNTFPVDDGGVNYFSVATAGIAKAKGNIFAGTSLWGVSDADNRAATGAPNRNFLTEGHATTRDSFYEMSIPLSVLQITRAQLEANGIGVMVGAGSASTMDTAPHDEATLDTPGVETWNSSLEWGDVDSLTSPFSRIAAPK